jgi:hypothetical protein
MLEHYTLIGQTPVIESDLLTWARAFEIAERRVALTRVLDLCEVSTIFLGLDHNWSREGPPILFESMAFWLDEGGYEQARCATWSEAEQQHAAMVRELARPISVLRFAARTLAGAWQSAAADWKQRWKEL